MKTKTLSLLAVLIGSVLSFGFFSDEDPLKNLLTKLEKLRTDYPAEKIYLHLNKPYYAIGDTIWFKAYLVKAETNQLSGLSKIVYVELINEKDSVKKSLILPVSAGLSWGDIALTDSLTEGNYRIRAYTKWMRNFGEEYFFDKTIRIGNSITNDIITSVNYTFSQAESQHKVQTTISFTDLAGKPLENKEVTYDVQLEFRSIAKGKGITDSLGKLDVSFINDQPFLLKSGRIYARIKIDDKKTIQKIFPVKATTNAIDIQFFPEGGNLVNGIRSKVAFKAVRADGLGANVSGQIVDEQNNKVVDFSSEHLGMGVCAFTPVEGKTYTAILNLPNSAKRIELPKALKEGYVITVNNNNADSLNIKITASPGLVNTGEVVLVAQHNHAVEYVAKNKLGAVSFSATLPKKRLSTGILHFTLFSPSLQPIVERLVFIRKNDQLQINISSGKNEYSPREKAKLMLDVEDAEGKPVQGSFSLSVVDAGKIQSPPNSSIFSNLLLTSDLKGYIENSNYYFINPDKDKEKHLDFLMLTQGWRRFVWKSLLSNTYPPINFAPEQSLEISGRVTTSRSQPVVKGKVLLLSTSGNGITLDTLTDAQGKFKFDKLFFTDNTEFVIEARDARNKKNVRIDMDRISAQLVTRNKNTPEIELNVNQSLLPYLRYSRQKQDELKKLGLIKRSIVLEEVKVVEKKAAVKYSSNLNGAGNADQVLQVDDSFVQCSSLIQCLYGRLTGVIFRNGMAYTTRGGGVMQIMVDGTFTNPDFLSYIPPADVETIEVLRSGSYLALYGMRAGNGIIMINTKRGEASYDPNAYAKGIASHSPQGYYLSREFYSPDYENPKTNTKIPDLRTAIFWKPNIVTDAQGKASVDFFNADSKSQYKVIIEGVSLEGKLGHQQFNYTVK